MKNPIDSLMKNLLKQNFLQMENAIDVRLYTYTRLYKNVEDFALRFKFK